MYKSYVPYLQHILDECLYVRSVITDDMQKEEFLRDETLKRAVTRSLSIIGEATKKIPAVLLVKRRLRLRYALFAGHSMQKLKNNGSKCGRFQKLFVSLHHPNYNNMATTLSNISVDQKHEATLSNAGGFTAFCFGGYNIRFKAPYSLERYTDVVKWENGYLVVMAKYRHNAEPEEEYIDLKPIWMGYISTPMPF